jgi:hypothetical protein
MNYFTSQYLFYINSAFVSPGEKLFFILGVVLLLLAIVTKIAGMLAPSPVDSKHRNKFYMLFLTIGIAEVVWYGLRYQNVRFFGTRFVAWVILLSGLVWLITLLVKALRNYSKEKTGWEKQQLKSKYLPK